MFHLLWSFARRLCVADQGYDVCMFYFSVALWTANKRWKPYIRVPSFRKQHCKSLIMDKACFCLITLIICTFFKAWMEIDKYVKLQLGSSLALPQDKPELWEAWVRNMFLYKPFLWFLFSFFVLLFQWVFNFFAVWVEWLSRLEEPLWISSHFTHFTFLSCQNFIQQFCCQNHRIPTDFEVLMSGNALLLVMNCCSG